MAAAALGNMVSDMAGIGLAGYVEVLASGLGIEEPHLTGQQLMMKSTRLANYGGRALGIMFGLLPWYVSTTLLQYWSRRRGKGS